MKKSAIARQERVSRNFVIKWTTIPEQDFSEDKRGWAKGMRRKWNGSTGSRLEEIHKYLKEEAKEFYAGAAAIQQEWRIRYPEEAVPPLRTIGQILKDLELTKGKKKKRKGAARYLCCPEHTIYNDLGGRVLEADFIGKKYIKNRSEPINFVGFSFKKKPKLRYYKRIESQTSDQSIKQCKSFFTQFEKPDFIKVDN